MYMNLGKGSLLSSRQMSLRVGASLPSLPVCLYSISVLTYYLSILAVLYEFVWTCHHSLTHSLSLGIDRLIGERYLPLEERSYLSMYLVQVSLYRGSVYSPEGPASVGRLFHALQISMKDFIDTPVRVS